MTRAIIYTKPSCIYCDRAKDLLEDMDIPYTEFPLPQYRETYSIPDEKRVTAPQIFLDGTHVGGYDDLSLLLNPS